MMAALAASSVVGGSGRGEDDLGMLREAAFKGLGLDDRVWFWDALSGMSRVSPLTRASAVAGLLPNGEDIGKVGRTLTGIITTFLKDARKSRLSACRLTFDIYIDCIVASCSESFLSQSATCPSEFRLKNDISSIR